MSRRLSGGSGLLAGARLKAASKQPSTPRRACLSLLFLCALSTLLPWRDASAVEPAPQATEKNAESSRPSPPPTPLNPEKTILLDRERGRLLLQCQVVLRQGVLEMLVCPKQTKEHESILSLDGKAQVVHAGLLALGANPGRPARFVPEYQPPEGQEIEIIVVWKDAQGKEQRRPAQDWVRTATARYYEEPLARVPDGVPLDQGNDTLRYDAMNQLLLWYGQMSESQLKKLLGHSSDEKYQAAIQKMHRDSQPRGMNARFLFTGSLFSKLEDGTEVYLAESGSLICVANFGDAMIDIDIPSTSSNDAGLLFEPWTERIPPVKTPVTVELIPVKKGDETGAAPSPPGEDGHSKIDAAPPSAP